MRDHSRIITHFHCFIFVSLFWLANPALTQETIGGLREWKSKSGTSLNGALTAVVDGKAGLLKQGAKEIMVPIDKLSDADGLLVKRTIIIDLQNRIRATQGGKNDKTSSWPEIFFVPDENVSQLGISKEGDWNVAKSKHWEIRYQEALPENVIRDLATLLEGAAIATGLIHPRLISHGKTFEFRLYPSLASLESENKDRSPGSDYRNKRILAVNEMIGLQKVDGKWVLDPTAKNLYLKEEITQLAMNHAGISSRVPYWFFYGASRLISKIPHRGAVWFPGAVLEEYRLNDFRNRVIKEMDGVVKLNSSDWNDPGDSLRNGRSQAIYHRHMREASSAVVALFCVLNERAGSSLEKMVDLSAKSDSPKSGELSSVAVNNRDLSGQFKEQIGNRISGEPRFLSAVSVRRPRTWTNQEGKTLLAELRGVRSGGKVILQTPAGRIYTIALAVFSPKDQGYVLMNLGKAIDYGRLLSRMAPSQIKKKVRFPAKLTIPGGLTQIRFDRKNSKPGQFVYSTKNFSFTVFGKAPIVEDQMEALASWFEGTYELLGKSPLGVQASRVDGFYRAEIFDSDAAYHLAGGPRMSAGAYYSSKQKFLMPAERGQLLPRNGTDGLGDSQMEIKYRNNTLVHEITHMMMHDILDVLPKWVIEGTAEYVEHIPKIGNTFYHEKLEDGLEAQSATYQKWSRSLKLIDGTMSEPYPPVYDFGKLITISRRDWSKYVGSSSSKQACMYYSSYLLTYYFMTEESERFLEFVDTCRGGIQQWKVYNEEYDQYRVAVDAFKKLPGVNVRENGSYTYDRHLAHPDRPVRPTQDRDTNLLHVKTLLGGRSPEALNQQVRKWYTARSVFLGL